MTPTTGQPRDYGAELIEAIRRINDRKTVERSPERLVRAFSAWIARTNGEEAPNDDECYGMMIERARYGNSFTAEDVLWLDNYLRTRTQESGYEKQDAGPLPGS